MLSHIRKRQSTLLRRIRGLGSPSSSSGGAVKPPFDPGTYDTVNLAELWDGDVAGALNWVGSHAGNTLVYGKNGSGIGLPVLVVAGLNGHNYVQFGENGVYENYAQVATPVRAQPTTQYFVIGKNTHIGNRYLFDDGVIPTRNTQRCVAPSPNEYYVSVGSGINPMANSPALGTWIVITIIKQAGAGASKIQVNNLAPSTWTQATLLNDAGLTINANQALAGFVGITTKVAYIIQRTGADTVADQNLFINYLRSRFSI